MKRGPQVFDLSTSNLHEYVGHYVPARARSTDEAERRRSNPGGTVILEAQHDGVRIAQRAYELLNDDKANQLVLARELGVACLNTAYYSYANSTNIGNTSNLDKVARRRLQLPIHARVLDDGEVEYESEQNNHDHTIASMARAATFAGELEEAHIYQIDTMEQKLQRQFGREIGNLGLRLVAAPLIGQRARPDVIQINVRDAGTDAIRRSRELYDDMYPTIAQLSDLDSQLAVEIRRLAPTPVRNVIITATDKVLEERSNARAA